MTETFTPEQLEQLEIHNRMGYNQLHLRYERAKARLEATKTRRARATAQAIFQPIQYAFLTNRQLAMPTECYQIIASFLDRESRVQLGQCDKHLHDWVMYGPTSPIAVWREGVYKEVTGVDENGDEIFVMLPYMEQQYEHVGDEGTALMHASLEGNASMVRILFAAKANVEAMGHQSGSTALYLAAMKGHIEVMNVLVAAGANINALSMMGISPLCVAAITGHLPTVNRLLELGADIHLGVGNYRPLFLMAVNNRPVVLRALLDANANVHAMDVHGTTALHFAAAADATDVIPVLLAAGANVNHVDDINRTPLYTACYNRKSAAVAVLLAANADPNIHVTHDGMSPLMVASQICEVEMVRALLAANANVHAAMVSWTALHFASICGSAAVIPLLIAAGADVNHVNESETPLYMACCKGKSATVTALLVANANPNIITNDGWSPLMKASEKGSDDIVRSLLAANANVHLVNNEGHSALWQAKEYGGDEIVRLLLDAGAVDDDE